MTSSARQWINTRSGVAFRPLDARAEDVKTSDIAFALSNLCRYAGHVEFYSVAEHSVIVSRIVTALGGSLLDRRAALMHDATEAYLVDLPRPIKHAPELAPYRAAEARLGAVIAARYGLKTLEPPIVQQVDGEMITLESERLIVNMHPDWTFRVPAGPVSREAFRDFTSMYTLGCSPELARRLFLAEFERLFAGSGIE